MEVGMPIIDAPYHEESKDGELIRTAYGARAGQERDSTQF
jgi:hypothetical protein